MAVYYELPDEFGPMYGSKYQFRQISSWSEANAELDVRTSNLIADLSIKIWAEETNGTVHYVKSSIDIVDLSEFAWVKLSAQRFW